MNEADQVFAGSIPAIYDGHLGPLIFAPYAADIARRVANIKAESILEIAAGTGVVTRALDRALPQASSILATDLNAPMVEFGSAQHNSARVTWRQADALALPCKDGQFDVVICQFGVMFFPDKRAAYREALRVLKPDGRLIFNAWERIEDNEFAHVVTESVAAIFPADPPRFLARTPHGYHDAAAIREDLDAAGFRTIEIDTVAQRSRAPSHRDPAIGFCQGTPLRNEIEARDKNRLAEATDAAVNAIAARFGTGPVDGKMQAHVITAMP